jgi:hypothetical protein
MTPLAMSSWVGERDDRAIEMERPASLEHGNAGVAVQVGREANRGDPVVV